MSELNMVSSNEEELEEEEGEGFEEISSGYTQILKHLEKLQVIPEEDVQSDTNTLNVKLDNKSRPSQKSIRHPKSVILTRQKPKPKPKPRVPIPTNLQKVFANKSVVKEHYFSAGSKITEENKRDLLTEQSPFKYPEDLEEFAYKILTKKWTEKINKRELGLKYYERNSYQSRQQLDRLNRLYVEEPKITNFKTVTDYDPQYFKTISNRPIDKPFKVNDYVRDLREIMRTKITTGYRMDELYLMEENIREEERIIEEIRNEFKIYIAKFEEFLQDDYTVSIEALRKSENEEAKSQTMYFEYVELSKELSSITSLIYRLEERWRLLKLYQKCLYMASPLSWRLKHDYYISLEAKPTTSDIFAKYKLTSSEMASLHKLIQNFKEGTAIQKEPALYFEEPKQLWQVFRFMEIQNLNSLLHCEELENPVQNAKLQMENVKRKFDNELSELQELVHRLAGGILWEEERARLLENLARELITGKYREYTINSEVLDLQVFVEDVFEFHVASNDANLLPVDMMKIIELKYRQLVMQLDQLPQSIVHKAESSCYYEEAKMMKVAIEAARKVIQIERMIKNLSRILEPVPIRYQKELKWRSPPLEVVKSTTPPPEQLSTEEVEQLLFFNDLCEADVED